jgi:uncharacterized membrane protein YuzA (DUF378 family)
MIRLTVIDWIAFILVVVGALNWGLVGLFQFDLVAAIFGNMSMLSRTVYSLVGVGGIWVSYVLFRLANR